MPKTDKQILDEALAQQAAGTYVDPLVEAKRTLQRADDLARMTEIDAQNMGNSIRPLTRMQRLRGSIDSVLDEMPMFKKPHEAVNPNAHSLAEGVAAAALPAAMFSNPVGAAATGVLGLQGLYNATDPNASNAERALSVAGAGLGFGQAARTARMPFKALGVGDEIAAEAASAPRTFSTKDVVHNGELAGTLEAQPSRAEVFDMTGNGRKVPQHVPGKFDKLDPEYMAQQNGRLTKGTHSVNDELDDMMFGMGGAGPEDVRESGRLATVPRPKPSTFEERLDFTRNPVMDVADEVPAVQEMPGPEDVPSLEGLLRSIGEVPTSRAAQRAAKAKARSGPVVREELNRKTEAAVRAFQEQQKHGMAGFTGLPELSLAELSRISGNIDRIRK